MMRHLWTLALLILGTAAQAAQPIAWRTTWDDSAFAQAAREHKYVLLDLHAVWCHWCHVMDEETYSDARVQSLMNKHYIAISVDADSDPDLTARYGNWGWPATIVLAADGAEIAKRRGYIAAPQMASLLQAIVDDPTPGPSVTGTQALAQSTSSSLAKAQRAALERSYRTFYDEAHGGWGEVHKYVDAPAMEWTYARVDAGDAEAARRARQTLDANLNLVDRVWGGVYQYSDEVDWKSPHFEKLLAFQADDLRLYSEAYARWRDPRYLEAARSLHSYIAKFMTAPDGGFYVSQDADLSTTVTGHDFYKLDDAHRRAVGVPRVDTHEYARETGWAIRGLTKFYDVTGDAEALKAAERGGRWAIEQRATPDHGFRHDATDRGGPFLDDNVAMAQALLALYRSTGERTWLTQATVTLDFIEAHLKHKDAGFIAAPVAAGTRGVFREPIRAPEQNAAIVQAAELANHYTGNERYAKMAQHAMRFLVSYAHANPKELRSEILLADRTIANPPIHIAIVGGKRDSQAQALHTAALAYPAEYLQIDWWDRDEGALPNPEIQYPKLDRPAAFACANGACSTPVYEAAQVEAAVRRILNP